MYNPLRLSLEPNQTGYTNALLTRSANPQKK